MRSNVFFINLHEAGLRFDYLKFENGTIVRSALRTTIIPENSPSSNVRNKRKKMMSQLRKMGVRRPTEQHMLHTRLSFRFRLLHAFYFNLRKEQVESNAKITPHRKNNKRIMSLIPASPADYLHVPQMVSDVSDGFFRQACCDPDVDEHVAVTLVRIVPQSFLEHLLLCIVPRRRPNLFFIQNRMT